MRKDSRPEAGDVSYSSPPRARVAARHEQRTVSLVGYTNAGKSTLLNTLMQMSLPKTSSLPHMIRGQGGGSCQLGAGVAE